MRFECNCMNETEFKEMLDEIRNEEFWTNYEIGARLWFTPEGFNKTIMVEYQIATKDCRELVGDDDVADWFTAYEVENEDDYDCSDEIDTDETDDGLMLCNLEKAMCDFAKKIFETCYN